MTSSLTLSGAVRVHRASDSTVLGHVVFAPTGFRGVRHQDDLVLEEVRARHAACSPLDHGFQTLDAAVAWVGRNPHLPDLSDLGLHGVPGLVGQTLWQRMHTHERYSFVGVVRLSTAWNAGLDHMLDGLLHGGVVGVLLRTPFDTEVSQVEQVVVLDTFHEHLTLYLGKRGGSTGFGHMGSTRPFIESIRRLETRLTETFRDWAPHRLSGHETVEAQKVTVAFEDACIRYGSSWDGWRADILARIESGIAQIESGLLPR